MEDYGTASKLISDLAQTEYTDNLTVMLEMFGTDDWKGSFMRNLSDRVLLSSEGIQTADYSGDGEAGRGAGGSGGDEDRDGAGAGIRERAAAAQWARERRRAAFSGPRRRPSIAARLARYKRQIDREYEQSRSQSPYD